MYQRLYGMSVFGIQLFMLPDLGDVETQVGQEGTHRGVSLVARCTLRDRALIHAGRNHATPHGEHRSQLLRLGGDKYPGVHHNAGGVVVIALQPWTRTPCVGIEIPAAVTVHGGHVPCRLHERIRAVLLVCLQDPTRVTGDDRHLLNMVSHVAVVIERLHDVEAFLPVRLDGDLVRAVRCTAHSEGHDLPIRAELSPHDGGRQRPLGVVRFRVDHTHLLLQMPRTGGDGLGKARPVRIKLPPVRFHELVELPVVLTRQQLRRDDGVVLQNHLFRHSVELFLGQLVLTITVVRHLSNGMAGHRVQRHVVEGEHRIRQRAERQSVVGDVCFGRVVDCVHQIVELHA